MCGIVGFIGNKSAITPVINGLKSLEYRGYDSAGITSISKAGTKTIKTAGRVESLQNEISLNGDLNAKIAIGHTRWATHGPPSQINAHPHSSNNQKIHVVHNGIIENYQELKDFLISKDYKFYSDTDTEVIPNLIDYNLKRSKDFLTALKTTLLELQGAYAIGVLDSDNPEIIYVAKLSSPLVIGIGKKSNIIASDISAISGHTNKVMFLDDYELAVVKNDSVKIHNYKESQDILKSTEQISNTETDSGLDGYSHYMLKEIFEAPQTVQSATLGRLKPETNTVKLGGLDSVADQLQYIDRIVIVACGTSYYAGLVGEYLIEEIAGIPVEVQLASEFKYRKEPFSRSTALLAISQSGETADTIAALKKVENYGVLRLGLINSVGSTIARMTDAGVYCHAGPEKSVASTKAFVAQVTILAEIALHLSNGNSPLYKPVLDELLQMPNKIKEILKDAPKIEKIATKYSKNRDFIFLGRNNLYPCALEGALKLKEVSYIHAEGYAAGEMKHGPLALIDSDFPTFAIAPDNLFIDKTLSNLEEIKARGGPIVSIATKGNKSIERVSDDVIYIPKTLEQLQPLLVAVVMQLFAYNVAVIKKLDVDKPRNLAKSVTVE